MTSGECFKTNPQSWWLIVVPSRRLRTGQSADRRRRTWCRGAPCRRHHVTAESRQLDWSCLLNLLCFRGFRKRSQIIYSAIFSFIEIHLMNFYLPVCWFKSQCSFNDKQTTKHPFNELDSFERLCQFSNCFVCRWKITVQKSWWRKKKRAEVVYHGSRTHANMLLVRQITKRWQPQQQQKNTDPQSRRLPATHLCRDSNPEPLD